jgi:hypothetical protein
MAVLQPVQALAATHDNARAQTTGVPTDDAPIDDATPRRLVDVVGNLR